MHQELENIVENCAIGAGFIEHGDILEKIRAEKRRSHGRLPGFHGIDVLAECVDFAVVGNHMEGLGERP